MKLLRFKKTKHLGKQVWTVKVGRWGHDFRFTRRRDAERAFRSLANDFATGRIKRA